MPFFYAMLIECESFVEGMGKMCGRVVPKKFGAETIVGILCPDDFR